MAHPQQDKGVKKGRNLWLWVVIAFMVLITAWTVLIVIAAKNQPELIEIQIP